MLSGLETRIADALRKNLPTETAIHTGPAVTPKSATEHSVTIFAKELKTLAASNRDGEHKRDAAYQMQRHALQGDGNTLDFPLTHADGELVEVEISPGRLARPGDQYWCEQKILRFYRAPTGPFQVLLRGEHTAGYREVSKASILLEITVRADQSTAQDDLINITLASLLTGFIDLDFIQLAEVSTLGFRLRLLKPLANLQSLKRDTVSMNTKNLMQATMQLELAGELEIALATGQADTESHIQALQGKMRIVSPADKEQAFQVSEK